MYLSKLTITVILVVSSLGLYAQGFEGSIYFTKSNMMDVTQYAYHVKDNMVRIDEMVEGSDQLVATLLVNLETQQMIALSHERNLYMKRPRTLGEKTSEGTVVLEGKLKRSIHGIACTQYRVKNTAADREIMYWVSEGDYAFFPKLLSILKRSDNFSTYYMAIPDLGNKFPLMAQENTLLREKKGFLQIDRLEEKTLDNSLFEIPDDFVAVER